MDREAPLTKHNWMCELSSSPRTKQLPSLHYRGELISILTSPLLIRSHALSSCCCTNTPQTIWVLWNSMVERKKLTQDYLTIVRKTVHTWVIVHTLGGGWKAISAKQRLHGPLVQEASSAYRAEGKSYSFLSCQAINPSAHLCTSEDKNSNPLKVSPSILFYLIHFKMMSWLQQGDLKVQMHSVCRTFLHMLHFVSADIFKHVCQCVHALGHSTNYLSVNFAILHKRMWFNNIDGTVMWSRLRYEE